MNGINRLFTRRHTRIVIALLVLLAHRGLDGARAAA